MKYFLIFVLYLVISQVQGQRVGSKPPKFILENYSSMSNDGTIFFDIDVKMSDCLSHIEIKDVSKLKTDRTFWDWLHDFWWFKILRIFDFERSKTFSRTIDIENYYLKEEDDGLEHIHMKVELLSLKSIFGRDEKKKILVNLYSLSSKIIYSKEFYLNRNKLIEESTISN
jgi:hypothetical protein